MKKERVSDLRSKQNKNGNLTHWLRLVLLLFTFGIFVLMAFGMNLPYNLANSDIILYTSILPDVLLVLMDLTEILVLAIAFSVILFALFMRTPSLGLTLLYCGAALFRRICELAVALILNHVIDTNDIFLNGLYLVFDILLVWAVWLIGRICSKEYHKKLALRIKASALFDDNHSEPISANPNELYPFQKIYSKENPLQRCALAVSILLSAIKVIDRIIFDIGYGAPEDFSEILVMFIYYSSDLLLGVIFYILSVFVYHRLFRKHHELTSVSNDPSLE